MRQTNEDTILINNGIKLDKINQILVNAIFDGHNGSRVSKLAKENFSKHLQDSFQNNQSEEDEDICNNIVKSFLQFDLSTKNVVGGSAALFSMFTDQILYVANAGDSRCICVTTDLKHYQQLSTDFKPAIDIEKKRLEKIGCKVEQSTYNQNGFQIQLGPQRVFPGGLSVSRSFGDWQLKDENTVKELIKQLKFGNIQCLSGNKTISSGIHTTESSFEINSLQESQDTQNSSTQQQIISAVPEIQYLQLNDNYHIIVMGCDGVYDVLTNSDICKIIQHNYLQFRVKSLMQVIMRNIEKPSSEFQNEIKLDEESSSSKEKINWFKKFGVRISSSIELVQKILQKAKIKYLVNYEDQELSEELLLQSDYLCAQMLAKKIVQMALQRESTDNVSVCLSILRFPTSPKSIQQYRMRYENNQKKKQYNRSFFKRDYSISDNGSEDYSQCTDSTVKVFISSDDPSKEYY